MRYEYIAAFFCSFCALSIYRLLLGTETLAHIVGTEFAHPDLAIMATLLAYYDDGLNEDQLKLVFFALSKKGRSERNELYGAMFSLSQPLMSPNEATTFASFDSINTHNDRQMKKLIRFFGKNFETINLYLNYAIFPVRSRLPFGSSTSLSSLSTFLI